MNGRRADLHPEVQAVLSVLDAGFPDVTAFPAAEVRAVIDRARAEGAESARPALMDWLTTVDALS